MAKTRKESPIIISPIYIGKSIPISLGAPVILFPSFSDIAAINKTIAQGSPGYDQTMAAQEIFVERGELLFSHLTVPFSSPSQIKGVYLCVSSEVTAICLNVTLTMEDGRKTLKKYQLPQKKDWTNCFFLPIDTPNVLKCEIEGNGIKNAQESGYVAIYSIAFIRDETSDEILSRETFERLLSSSLNVEPVFICDGGRSSVPISRCSDPTILIPDISLIDTKHQEISHLSGQYDAMESNAPKMLVGEGSLTCSSILVPFKPAVPVKGAYISTSFTDIPSTLYMIVSTKSEEEEEGEVEDKKVITKYQFTQSHSFGKLGWYFLPIDVTNASKCELYAFDCSKDVHYIEIDSLIFVRNETPEEKAFREQQRAAKEKLWSEATLTKAIFHSEGGYLELPIDFDDPSVIPTDVPNVRGRDETFCKESEYYSSSKAQQMIEEGGSCTFSHLFVPFFSPTYVGSAFVCLDKSGPPILLCIFTHSDGTKTSKKYEFVEPSRGDVWCVLDIDLANVVTCEIQARGKFSAVASGNTTIESLMFIDKQMSAEDGIQEEEEEEEKGEQEAEERIADDIVANDKIGSMEEKSGHEVEGEKREKTKDVNGSMSATSTLEPVLVAPTSSSDEEKDMGDIGSIDVETSDKSSCQCTIV
ncbi:hypothetical protein ADUPG1_011965 [Aduncisulcus paluster]|uniref:Uncharacterized protein n=1 Tax=Aduncisulcus paluster TaxID=2918883 RepID=A0ABQ5JXU1_9EUKA|nr:hypothetical protein ADUPG1_011965 [Aduncisulcus paluster]